MKRGGIHKLGNGLTAINTYCGAGHAALVANSGLPQHNAVTGQRGNLTTTQSVYNSSGAILQTEQAYEDTGNPVKVTTPNGASTYYWYMPIPVGV